ncbi:MAG TPA: NB-ARC domain-containing protein, partial [Ktedonobacteraceae bacterium]|nr:NB-ARC domain-containing protein [Ktedonobacteraceae bacterium]
MEKRQPFHLQLKRERERLGWSQEKLAEELHIDEKTVSRWESGERVPRPYNREELFKLFGKDPESFGIVEDNELREDWGEAPGVPRIYGRKQEGAELARWIEEEQCRVIAVLGMGGVGKTTFAVKLARQVRENFTCIFWRSLQHAPSLEHIVQQCIHFLARQHETTFPEELDEQITLLIGYLREQRCLLILDNVESILQSGQRAGQYEKGYEGYGRLIQRIGDAEHQSCLLLTSREKPEYIAHVEGKASPVRSFPLSGVGQSDGRKLLQNKELLGSDEQWAALVALYAGNPLALQLVAEPIHVGFGGDIARFLQEEKTAIGDINVLLEQQFHRLSAQEQEILYWLAIEREAIPLEEIRQNLVHVVAQDTLLEGLASLRRRSMIETRSANTFTLQPVIMEYVTMHLVKQACHDFNTATPGVWVDYAFIKAQVKDYVRDIQLRFILSPIVERLRDTLGQHGIEQGLKDMLVTQRRPYSLQRSYIAGNALNL